MTNPKPSRKRWRIALAVVVVFAAVGWLVGFPAYQRHRAIQEIERVGGKVYRETVGPNWLRQWGIGFERITKVSFCGTGTTEDWKQILNSPSYLDRGDISDDTLKHLGSLTSLESLSFNHTNITEDGLKHLSNLTNLRELLFCNSMSSNNEGLRRLGESLPKCQIFLIY